MQRRAMVVSAGALGFAALAALAACSDMPRAGSRSYKAGELGNGRFLFACADAVRCERWSGFADQFPDTVASGSTFNVRFVANGQPGGSLEIGPTGGSLVIDGTRYDGVTTQPIGPYLSAGPDGLSAVRPGYATIVTRDNRGTVIDLVTVKIVEPDDLVVYDATDGAAPRIVQKIDLSVGRDASLRTFGRHKLVTVAGSVRVSWESDDPTVASVVGYEGGVVLVAAVGEGKTKLRVVGAALTKEIDVEVSP